MTGCRKGRPAFAVCLSGGYEDDSDTGARFQYTGEGGQSGGKVRLHGLCLVV